MVAQTPHLSFICQKPLQKLRPAGRFGSGLEKFGAPGVRRRTCRV
jgi:hypothetical protein